MKLITLVEVNGQGLYNEVGIGNMLAFTPNEDGSLTISAEYCRADGTPVKSVPKTYSAGQVEVLYQAIQSDLTPGLNGVFSIWEQVEKAFILEMSYTFGISPTQIVKI